MLLHGILQGRRTFANTLKYVFMATSANFGNMFSMAGASLFLPFLPMLPKQVLLINFLTDLPEMTIAGDRVDDEFVTRPRRWDVAFIRRFMLVFGALSSVFDYLTFAMLSLVLHAGEAEFHTGWFVELILSAAVVVFALRTRLPFYKSRPSRAMLLATALVAIVTLALPYTPLAGSPLISCRCRCPSCWWCLPSSAYTFFRRRDSPNAGFSGVIGSNGHKAFPLRSLSSKTKSYKC